MKFPDFLTFEPFNALRQQMGATELGHFEFFDPSLHLSAEEREQLQSGMVLPRDCVTLLLDHTLAFKNSRVLVSRLQPTQEVDWVYHPAACDLYQGLSEDVRVTTQRPAYGTGTFQVCTDCLHLLHYKGFDVVRNRHRHYSQRLHEEFDLNEFFQHYRQYPLRHDYHKYNVVM